MAGSYSTRPFERVKDKADRFIASIKDPELQHKLLQQAVEVLAAIEHKLSPTQKKRLISNLFWSRPEFNPSKAPDTYGVEQVIIKLARDQQRARKAKRLYRSMIDKWIGIEHKSHRSSVVHEHSSKRNSNDDFNLQTFDTLVGLTKKLRYVKDHLNQLGEGSSRVVFDLGNGTVLKVAKNKAGLLQNSVEATLTEAVDSIFIAKVIKSSRNNTWLVSERAMSPISLTAFKNYAGYEFKDFAHALVAFHWSTTPQGTDELLNNHFKGNKAELKQTVLSSELFKQVLMLSQGNNIPGNIVLPFADLIRPSNWGILDRNGIQTPVLVDVGFSTDVAATTL